MNRELRDIKRMAAELRSNLGHCAADPEIDAVHDTRTGTRRLQATLENVVRHAPLGEAGQPLRQAATALMRQLKKIRRAAAPSRDLDVHRKLLEKLVVRTIHPAGSEAPGPSADMLETPGAGLRAAGIEQQADQLDAWLKHRRSATAAELQHQAPALIAKLDKRLAAFEAAVSSARGGRQSRPPALLALDNFASLATEMQLLDAGNLHDFRKGAKKARYVAELAAQNDAYAASIGKALKKLQDEIGDWHDWLVLAEEGRTALGEEAAELLTLLISERERHFSAAMSTAIGLRGRLMGEWLAAAKKPPRPAHLRSPSRPRARARPHAAA